MSSDYLHLLQRLLTINMTGGMKLGLKNSLKLDKLLDNPSQKFPCIHIAGTNGKGSVTTKIAAAYQEIGFKTGIYTSPHISCFRERIRIHEEMISEANVLKHLTTLFTLCDHYQIKATFFELTTLLAFLHFAEKKVDIAILETGLGGRLDATNICKPILTIITSISLEHTEILGDTIEAITYEKAGIIKPNIPILTGPRIAKAIIEKIAAKNHSPFFHVEGNFQDYHDENCAIAKQALEILTLPYEAIEKGLKTLPPCRFEMMPTSRLVELGYGEPAPKAVILDVAHNPDGLTHLLAAIQKRYPKIGLHFVIGFSSNKDIKGCLDIIKDHASGFHCVEGTNERAVLKEQLAVYLIELGISKEHIFCEPTINIAIQHAIEKASKKNELVVVCGTFFIMGQARQALGIHEPQDPKDMNER